VISPPYLRVRRHYSKTLITPGLKRWYKSENDSHVGALRGDGKPCLLAWWLFLPGQNPEDWICIAGNNRIFLPDCKSRNAERRHGCDGAFLPFLRKDRHSRGLWGLGQSNRPCNGNHVVVAVLITDCCKGPTRFRRGLQP
jgi:hypothetical protein